MKDAVRIFEEYCENELYLFYYGSEAHLNLLKGDDLDPKQIHLLLFPVTRRPIVNSTKTAFNGTSFSGKFMLLKGSDYAKHYFNENDTSTLDSKYTKNIEPMLKIHEAIGASFLCQGLELKEWKCQDAVNVLDANKDGIWCTFTMDDV